MLGSGRRPSRLALCLGSLVLVAAPAHAGAPTCTPAFLDNGLPGPTNGSNGIAIAGYKNGLYLGQAPQTGQDGFGLMRRVGNAWEPVGGGLSSPTGESFISDMVEYQGLLIACGVLGQGAVQSNIIAWDGQNYVDIYNSTTSIGAVSHDGWIRSVAVFDPDANGPLPESLIAVGNFASIGGDISLKNAVRWDGAGWSRMDSGLPPFTPGFYCHRLVVADRDGDGPRSSGLYMLCTDTSNPAKCLFQWNESLLDWMPVAGPFINDEPGGEIIFDIVPFDPDGPGPEPTTLVAAGTVFGTNRVAYLESFSGGIWSPLPGAPGGIFANSNTYWVSLAAHDPDGDFGPQAASLFMGRGFELNAVPLSTAIYRFDGSVYAAIQPDAIEAARALSVVSGLEENVQAPTLYAAGQSGGPPYASRAMRFDGFAFAPAARPSLDAFAKPTSREVTAALAHDPDGPGSASPALIVASRGVSGEISKDESFAIEPFHRWDGQTFQQFAPGLFDVNGCCEGVRINAMTQCDPDGFGPLAAFDGFAVVGDFDTVNLQTAYGVAIWNGTAWEGANTLSPNVDPRCVTPLPPGLSGGKTDGLFVGGNFSAMGGVPCSNVAIFLPFNSTWEGMGLGVNGTVHDAVIFDLDGESGTSFDPALYVAGEFTTAGGEPSIGLAVWTGFSWAAVPNGVSGPVFDLQLWDQDGVGGNPPALAVAGSFTTAGFDDNARGFARFNESGWVGLGDAAGFEYGTHLAVLDPDGAGSAGDKLYGVLSNLAANRRFAGLRQTGVSTWVWDNVASLGPPEGDGKNSLITIDDDGTGLNRDSIVIAGDMPTDLGGVPTDGLIRFAAPQQFLVDDIFATLNGAGAYLCGMIASASDDVIFDATAITGNPDATIFADLINSATFGSVNVVSGRVTIDLFGNQLILASPAGERPSLRVGDGSTDALFLTIYDSAGAGLGVDAQDVNLGAAPTPYFVPQHLTIADTTLAVNGSLRISPASSGGYMVVYGSNGALISLGTVSLGAGAGTNGELFFLNNASWNHSGGGLLEIAGEGLANLDIDSGCNAMTNFDVINVGASPSGSGTIDIGEAGPASWTQSGGSLFVGYQGAGLMKVRNGSTLIGLDCHLIIGHLPGSFGEVVLSDNGLPSSSIAMNEVSIGRFGGEGLLDMDAAGGVAAFNITIGRQGTVRGNGSFTVAGTLFNEGLIDPGMELEFSQRGITFTQTGEIDVFGNYQQLSAPDNMGTPGRLQIDIAGPFDADLLAVADAADLGGHLDVRFANGYVPEPGLYADGLTIVEAGDGIIGQFDVANFPGLAPGVTGEPRFLRFETRPILGTRGLMNMEVVIIEDTLASPPPAPAAQSQDYDVGGAGTDAALGDLNADGTIDLAITLPDSVDPVGNPGSVIILFNGGSPNDFWAGFTGTQQVTVPPNPSSIVVADFDGAMGNDICFTTLTSGEVHVLLNDGAGNFSFVRGDIPPLPLTGFPIHLIGSDFNRDGGPDVAVVTDENDACTILFNSRPANGTFTGFIGAEIVPIPPTMADGVNVDIDNDKWDEIVIPDEDGESITLDNNGPDRARGMPVFNPIPTVTPVPGDPVDVAAGDLNLDGSNDVAFATRGGNSVTVLLGDGSLSFLPPLTVPAGVGPSDLALIDLDNDGDKDIAVITTDEQNQRVVRVIRNDLFGGQLSFAPQADLLPGATPELVLGGDVTGDGNPDLVTVNNAGGVLRGGAGQDDVSVFTFAVCRGDANNDRIVDMADVSATLTNFLADYNPGTGPGDSNGDGFVNFRDITYALANWERDCR